MVLDFGLIGGQDKLGQTADYRTAGSHQSENLNFRLMAVANTWYLIHTVTTGKTYYISGISISGPVSTVFIGTGNAGSEVKIFAAKSDTGFNVVSFSTPIKISSDTKISGRFDSNTNVSFTLIGWEE